MGPAALPERLPIQATVRRLLTKGNQGADAEWTLPAGHENLHCTCAPLTQSMSDFHPGSWNPAWSVASMCVYADSIIGLQSFMCTDEMTTGSVLVSSRERRALAAQSHAFNASQRRFAQIFPEYAGPMMKDLPNMAYAPTEPRAPAEPQAQEQPQAQPPAAAPAEAPAPAETSAPADSPDDKAADAPAADAPRPAESIWSARNLGIAAVVVVAYLFTSRFFDAWSR